MCDLFDSLKICHEFQESWASFHFSFTPRIYPPKICALLKVCQMIYKKLAPTLKLLPPAILLRLNKLKVTTSPNLLLVDSGQLY